jgi:Uma2 family endonuclease
MSTISSVPTTELASGPIDLTVVEPDGHYEVVNGKVVEKPAMGVFETWFASELFGWLQRSPGIQEHGRVLSEMLFLLDAANDLKRRPDLAFVSHERWARNRPVPRTAAWEVIPDLAIEIISPTNLACEVLVRVDDYFRSGVRSVWVVYPGEELELVYIDESPTSVRILTRSDRLELPGILPGFQLPLDSLFERPAASVISQDTI